MQGRKCKLCTKKKLMAIATTLSITTVVVSLMYSFSIKEISGKFIKSDRQTKPHNLLQISFEDKKIAQPHFQLHIEVNAIQNKHNFQQEQIKTPLPVYKRIPPGYFISEIRDVAQSNGSLQSQKMVIPKMYRNDTQAFKKYLSYLRTTEKPLPYQTKGIILVTNYRSGSSFFGELLNQHPDVFYMFEPLIAVSPMERCNVNAELKRAVLKDLFQCKIPDWFKIFLDLPASQRPRMTNNIFNCMRKKFCFAPFTKELDTEKHCPRTNITRVHNPWEHCGSLNINLVNNECRRKKMVAIKVIRLCDLGNLEDVFGELSNDIKVVHLIRDPRGIANSRHTIHRKLKLRESVRFTCKRQGDNTDLGLYAKPKWLENKYKVFRYEDAALKPYEIAQQLYDFVGIDFPSSVKLWIEENTNRPLPDSMMRSVDSVEERESRGNETLERRRKFGGNPWGHSRDSERTVQKWRHRIPFREVKVIESVCSDIMRKMGYLPVNTIDDYQNMTLNFFTDHLPWT